MFGRKDQDLTHAGLSAFFNQAMYMALLTMLMM